MRFVKEEYNFVVNKIEQWYQKKNKTLSIVSPPYNEEIIFEKVITEVLNADGKVLYIWNGDKSNKKILGMIRKKIKNVSFNFITEKDCNEKLVFTNAEHVEKITDNFDLVIYDDITEFNNTTKQEIAIKYLWLAHISKKVILYTVEKTINIGEDIELTYLHKKNPFAEPRTIPTKIDLKKDMPYIVYDYLNWFMDKKECTVIIVPDEENIQFVYDYYSKKVKVSDCKIYSVKNKDYEKVKFNDGLKIKDKAIIIITDSIDLSAINFDFVNVVILFADNRKFNYKRILYLCGKAGKYNQSIPEILLVYNHETAEINAVKNIARGFNKRIWEKNYSRYLKK